MGKWAEIMKEHGKEMYDQEAMSEPTRELQNVREAFIACSETLYAEREQLRHSQEVSKALLDALKRIWPHARTENEYTTTEGQDYYDANELVRAAIALAERPDVWSNQADRQAIKAAVAAERERCAKIAESIAHTLDSEGAWHTGQEIAAAIRSGDKLEKVETK